MDQFTFSQGTALHNGDFRVTLCLHVSMSAEDNFPLTPKWIRMNLPCEKQEMTIRLNNQKKKIVIDEVTDFVLMPQNLLISSKLC